MTERVYVCAHDEADALKKRIAYDPYTDPNVIPPSSKSMTPEEEHARDEQVKAALAKLASEKYSNLIFNRQEYSLRDGRSVGLSPDSSYLYVNATDAFLKDCDLMFAEKFKTVKRAGADEEKKIIHIINDEKDRADSGFGMIFGG